MLRSILLLLFASLSLTSAKADAVGFREVDIGPEAGQRPLHFAVWYPSGTAGALAIVGETPAFEGIPVVKDGAPADGVRPLVVMSHGYDGSWRNLSWLATELVQKGYVVAAPDHPGTTTFNRDSGQASQLWERPHDLSRVVDRLIGDGSLAGRVDADCIAAIGHSLGGWTVLSIAGARFSTERFQKDCAVNPNPRTCDLSTELSLTGPPAGRLNDDLRDPRIKAAVSLDLGLARGFTPESLAAIDLPILVIGAGLDVGGLPADKESGYLSTNLPPSTSRYVTIPDAMHFSFMQLCKPGAAAAIEAESPGDGVVCRDGGERSRTLIHQKVANMVGSFLAKALPAE